MIVVTDNEKVYRFSAADTSLDSGIYGLLGRIFRAPGNTGDSKAVAIDANGDAIVLFDDGTLKRVNLADPEDLTGRYTNLGEIRPGALQGNDSWQGIAILANGNGVTMVGMRSFYINFGWHKRTLFKAPPTRAMCRLDWPTIAGCQPSFVKLSTSARGLISPRCQRPRIPPATSTRATPIPTWRAMTTPWRRTAAGGMSTVSIPANYQEIRLRPNLNSRRQLRRRRILRSAAFGARIIEAGDWHGPLGYP